MEFEPGPRRAEKFLRDSSGQGEYSVEKYRAAPESTLSPEEARFVDEYLKRFSEETAKQYPMTVSKILRGLANPDIWRVVRDYSKVDPLLKRDSESKEGQLALAKLEAAELNEELERRKAAFQEASAELADFIERLNGRRSLDDV